MENAVFEGGCDFVWKRPDFLRGVKLWGSCHKRQKPQAPIRNRQARKVANAKGLNRNNNHTKPNLT